MEALGNYILSIIAAAIIFGVLQSLCSSKSSSAALMRLLGGLFLALTVISPITDVHLDRALDMPLNFTAQGNALAAQGQTISQSELQAFIKQRCQSYILDKANSYQAQLEVEVTLSQDDLPTPTAVWIQGSVSPYAKKALQQWLEDDMGIRKENQVWIG